MVNKFPISSIGPGQLIDVTKSGKEVHNSFFRTCTVMQPKVINGSTILISDIGDTSPVRMAALFGGEASRWNRHLVVQVAGCPFTCWYCYVDNLRPDVYMSCQELVDNLIWFRRLYPELNVFHLMGGCPGAFAFLWPNLRRCLDENGLWEVILFTNVILVEELVYNIRPWDNIPDRTFVDACLKGTSKSNFINNTGIDLFEEAIKEASSYIGRKDSYFSLIGYDTESLDDILLYLGRRNVDLLSIKEYEVVRLRKANQKSIQERKC